MPCKIIVSNKSNAGYGEFLAVLNADHVLTRNESKQAWLRSGRSASTWDEFFYVFNIDDSNKEDLEFLLDVLLISTEPDEYEKKYFFGNPITPSAQLTNLDSDGEVILTTAEFLSFVNQRVV